MDGPFKSRALLRAEAHRGASSGLDRPQPHLVAVHVDKAVGLEPVDVRPEGAFASGHARERPELVLRELRAAQEDLEHPTAAALPGAREPGLEHLTVDVTDAVFAGSQILEERP